MWYLLGTFQPLPLNPGPNGIIFQPSVPYSDELNYQPRAITQSKTSRFCRAWEGNNWLEKATLDFFNEEDTEPFTKAEAAIQIPGKRQVRSSHTRAIYFAPPLTQKELMQIQSEESSSSTERRPHSRPNSRIRSQSRANNEEDIDAAEWELIDDDRRHSQWVDSLSARELLTGPQPVQNRNSGRIGFEASPEQSENPWALPTKRRAMRAWGAPNTNDSAETKTSARPRPSWGEDLPKMSEVRSAYSKENRRTESKPQKKDDPPPVKRGSFSKFEREEAPHPGRKSNL